VEVIGTAGLFDEIDKISKKGVSMATEESDGETEAEPMEVEDDSVYAQRYEDNMDLSGPDKMESAKLATEDWKQQGESFKASADEESFLREATQT
jgi:hypothetical protein